MQNFIYNVLNDMTEHLSINQMKYLQESLINRLEGNDEDKEANQNNEYIELFLSAKQIEGCSSRTNCTKLY